MSGTCRRYWRRATPTPSAQNAMISSGWKAQRSLPHLATLDLSLSGEAMVLHEDNASPRSVPKAGIQVRIAL
jgi:hypothetical protein